jgi:hypothetical protein
MKTTNPTSGSVKVTAAELNEDITTAQEEAVQQDEYKKFTNDQHKTAAQAAVNFLKHEYPHLDFEKVLDKYVYFKNDTLRGGARRSGLHRWKGTDIREIHINSDLIIRESAWSTYSRAGAHLMAEKIPVDPYFLLKLVYVHEMTHAIQCYEHRQPSEAETTANEIEYVRVNQPELMAQMKPSQTRRHFWTGQVIKMEGGEIVEVKGTAWFPNRKTWMYYLIDPKNPEADAEKVSESYMDRKVEKVLRMKKKATKKTKK